MLRPQSSSSPRRARRYTPHPSHRGQGGDATDQLTNGQNTWPPLGSSVGHGWAVLLSATGQIPLAVDRLVGLLARGDYCAAAIDAPFAIPDRHLPVGGWPTLLRDVEGLPTGSRPFAKGERLVTYAQQNASLEKKKPLRETEQAWVGRGVNVRSTLWNGPRGGAPFTVACITLLAKVNRPVWPWTRADRGLLVEAFPAGQLREWELSHTGYTGSFPSAERDNILMEVSRFLEIPDPLRSCCRSNPDALDAALCLFAARAAVDRLATPGDSTAAATREGWIATHPRWGSA